MPPVLPPCEEGPRFISRRDRGLIERYTRALASLVRGDDPFSAQYPFVRSGDPSAYMALRRRKRIVVPLRLDVLRYTVAVVEKRSDARRLLGGAPVLAYQAPVASRAFILLGGDPREVCGQLRGMVKACGRLLPLLTPDPGLEKSLTERLDQLLSRLLRAREVESSYQLLRRHAARLYAHQAGTLSPRECGNGHPCKSLSPLYTLAYRIPVEEPRGAASYTPVLLTLEASDPWRAYTELATVTWRLACRGRIVARSVVLDEERGVLAAVVWLDWGNAAARLEEALAASAASYTLEPVTHAYAVNPWR